MKLASVGFKASLTACVCATALLGNGWQNAGIFENSVAIAAEPTEIQAETQKLIGQWELNGLGKPDLKGMLIFTPNGKLYFVDSIEKKAIAADYQVNSLNGQIYLDVNQGSLGARVTFSFNSRGQLVIPQLLIPAGMQYSSNGIVGSLFLPNTLFLTRLSNDGKLPSNIEIIDPASPNQNLSRGGQGEAIAYLSLMNRAQQAYYIDRAYFTNNSKDLGIVTPLEPNKYTFQIVVLDAKKAVQNIALAKKDGLKSYTGLVYTQVMPSNGDLVTISLLCQSQKPTQIMPPRFELAPEPRCPDGYVPLN
jgi:hypothetical protein